MDTKVNMNTILKYIYFLLALKPCWVSEELESGWLLVFHFFECVKDFSVV